MFFKRDGKDDCIISGMVVGDSKEKDYNGESFYEFGIGMGKDKDGNNLPIVNIAVWGRKITFKKGDRALACGRLKITTKDEKTYYTLNADFCIKETREDSKEKGVPDDLTPVNDSDLPF